MNNTCQNVAQMKYERGWEGGKSGVISLDKHLSVSGARSIQMKWGKILEHCMGTRG